MTDPFSHLSPENKVLLDLASISTLLGSLMDLLPAVAAVLTIIWTGIRIYETDTVQKILGRNKQPKE